MHNLLKSKPKRKTFPARQLTWCELDVIGTFLIENRYEFRDHIKKFGYLEGEAKIMADHIANKIFNQMFNVDPDTNRKRHTQ